MNDAENPGADSVLASRAQLLARREGAALTDRAARPFLVLCVGAERYAVEVDAVARVMSWAETARVPEAHAAVLGVAAFEGEIRTVTDLTRLLDLPAEEEPSGRVVLLRRGGQPIGLRVDDVEAIRLLSDSDVQPSAEIAKHPLIAGVADDLLVLDLAGLLAHPALGGLAQGTNEKHGEKMS